MKKSVVFKEELVAKSVYARYSRYFNLEFESLHQEIAEVPTEFIYRADNPSVAVKHFCQLLKKE